MKSPHQASAKSTPKPITNATKGFVPASIAKGRCTPTSKTAAKMYAPTPCC